MLVAGEQTEGGEKGQERRGGRSSAGCGVAADSVTSRPAPGRDRDVNATASGV